jgi:uncharacterized Zn finger protein
LRPELSDWQVWRCIDRGMVQHDELCTNDLEQVDATVSRPELGFYQFGDRFSIKA